MRVRNLIAGAATVSSIVVCMTGCGPREDSSVKNMMWYRPGPPPARQANTIGVGRYGQAATYDRWGETGASSGSYTSTAASYGRWNSGGAAYSTWGATSVGGEPIGAGRGAGVVGYGGITASVHGGTATFGSFTESGATYGTIP